MNRVILTVFTRLQSLHLKESLNRAGKQLFNPFVFYTGKCVNSGLGDTCHTSFYSLFTLEFTNENKPVGVFFNLHFHRKHWLNTPSAFMLSTQLHTFVWRSCLVGPRLFNWVLIASLRGTSATVESTSYSLFSPAQTCDPLFPDITKLLSGV